MNKFETTYEQMLEMVSTGGVWGNSPDIGATGGSFGNEDSYATGDARVPKVIGGMKKCKTKGKNKSKECTETVPVQRRPKSSGM